jgi:hypothetical protein
LTVVGFETAVCTLATDGCAATAPDIATGAITRAAAVAMLASTFQDFFIAFPSQESIAGRALGMRVSSSRQSGCPGGAGGRN